MSFKSTLTAASIALLGSASVLAMPAPSEAKDGCGRAYRFSYSQQRCVLRTDVSLNRRFQRKADRFCGKAYRFSHRQQRCVRRTDVGPRVSPRVVYQPTVVRPVFVSPVVRPILRPVIKPVIQLSL